MISNMQNPVQVRMLHSSVYLRPILGADGAPQIRKVKYFDGEIDAPATQPVYCSPEDNGGIVTVPRDIADVFILNKIAVWPTKEVVVEPEGPELTPNAPASIPTEAVPLQINVAPEGGVTTNSTIVTETAPPADIGKVSANSTIVTETPSPADPGKTSTEVKPADAKASTKAATAGATDPLS